jgi:hypothetical protein
VLQWEDPHIFDSECGTAALPDMLSLANDGDDTARSRISEHAHSVLFLPTVCPRHPHATHMPPTCHPHATHVPPTCHPHATHVPPTRDPYATHTRPVCHPHATHMPTICHPSQRPCVSCKASAPLEPVHMITKTLAYASRVPCPYLAGASGKAYSLVMALHARRVSVFDACNTAVARGANLTFAAWRWAVSRGRQLDQ